MNVFDQYGIKEVADVQIFSIHKKTDGSGDVYYVPALYLDTTKVNTLEQSGEISWATGGRGNAKLVGWDHSKNINLSMTDALCSPASLGLCWGGRLSANWKDGDVDIKSGINKAVKGYERISRMERAYYPKYDGGMATVADNIPHIDEDVLSTTDGVKLKKSAVLDGVDIRGYGQVEDRPYKWKLQIDSRTKSVAFVPNKFFSIYGKEYPIKENQVIGINQSTDAFKYEIIYKRAYKSTVTTKDSKSSDIYHRQDEQGLEQLTGSTIANQQTQELKYLETLNAAGDGYLYDFLKVRVCHDGSVRIFLSRHWDQIWYSSLTGETSATPAWDSPDTKEIIKIMTGGAGLKTINNTESTDIGHDWVEVSIINQDQFRGQELFVRFKSLNALSYYILTKYEKDIYKIAPKDITINQVHWTRSKLRNILFGTAETEGIIDYYPDDQTSTGDNKRKTAFFNATNKDLTSNYTYSWDKTKGVNYSIIKTGQIAIYYAIANGESRVKHITFNNTPITYKTKYADYISDGTGGTLLVEKDYDVNWLAICQKVAGTSLIVNYDTSDRVLYGNVDITKFSRETQKFLKTLASDPEHKITVSYTITPLNGQPETTTNVTTTYDEDGMADVNTVGINYGQAENEQIQFEISNPVVPEDLINAMLIANKKYGTQGVRPSQNTWVNFKTLMDLMYTPTKDDNNNYPNIELRSNSTKGFIPYRLKNSETGEYTYSACTVAAYNAIGDKNKRADIYNGQLTTLIKRGLWYDIFEYLEVFDPNTSINNPETYSLINAFEHCFAYKILASGKLYITVNTIKLAKTLDSYDSNLTTWERREDIFTGLRAWFGNGLNNAISGNNAIHIIDTILNEAASGAEGFDNAKSYSGQINTVQQTIINYVTSHATKIYNDFYDESDTNKDFVKANFLNAHYVSESKAYNDIISYLRANGYTTAGLVDLKTIGRLMWYKAINDMAAGNQASEYSYSYYIGAHNTQYGSINNLLNAILDVMTRQFNPANENSLAYNCGISYKLTDPEELLMEKTNAPAGKYDFLSHTLWAYVNPRTMKPYDDDYWFKSGEPYIKKSLTMSTKSNPVQTKKIFVEAGTFPGMYKIVCEALIRRREDGNDEHMQIVLPLCKIKSEQSLQLSADGDPTTFNLNVEVATPRNNVPVEINFYETTTEQTQEFSGYSEVKDGSTIVKLD